MKFKLINANSTATLFKYNTYEGGMIIFWTLLEVKAKDDKNV